MDSTGEFDKLVKRLRSLRCDECNSDDLDFLGMGVDEEKNEYSSWLCLECGNEMHSYDT